VRLRHALSLPSTLLLSAGRCSGSWLGSGPTSRGREVAVLPLHAASAGHVTKAAYSCVRGMYMRHGTKCARTPKKRPNFRESPKSEVRRIPILLSWVNKEPGNGSLPNSAPSRPKCGFRRTTARPRLPCNYLQHRSSAHAAARLAPQRAW
jgi:hypothetical protein